MNTFVDSLKREDNYKLTENGGVAYKSTLDAVYDMFALGGAYRSRSEEDCIFLFKKALEENEKLALKCLFYLRDVREGAGERRFFRVCYKWLCNKYPDIAKRNLESISEYGRWDDLINIALDTKIQDEALEIIKKQLLLDVQSQTPSLLAKWMPSCNTSSKETRRKANKVRNYLKMTQKGYRKILSKLRERINIVERLMSSNQWDLIEFDKIPSKAGLIYKNAFARRDIIAEKYKQFIESDDTKVNAATLYPYEIVAKVTKALESHYSWYSKTDCFLSDLDRQTIEKYWNNQKDYLQGKDCKMLCVCDTSGSMTCGGRTSSPINIAIGLSMYCAERIGGPFKNTYISFASRPQIININGVDFADKVKRIYDTNLCDDTNLEAVFDLLKKVALKPYVNKQDLPEVITVISDMEINHGSNWSEEIAKTEMERIRQDWEAAGLKMPRLVYWNVNARQDTILDLGENITLCSGASPSLFESILTGKNGKDLMLEKLNSKRYEAIQ